MKLVRPTEQHLPGYVAAFPAIATEANGGVLVERFIKPAQFGGTEGLRYRIALA
jgi:hypothetical protein